MQERPLEVNKIVLNEQVFTVLNIMVSDGGIYSCKATNQAGNYIMRRNNIVVVVQQSELTIMLICGLDNLQGSAVITEDCVHPRQFNNKSLLVISL